MKFTAPSAITLIVVLLVACAHFAAPGQVD